MHLRTLLQIPSGLFGRPFANSRTPQHRRYQARLRPAEFAVPAEVLEDRRMLAGAVADDLTGLNDEFDDATTINNWQRLYQTEGWGADQLQAWDIDQTQAGRMTMQPHTVVWYQNWRGPIAYQEITGDFVVTSEIIVTDRDDVGGSDADDIPQEAQFSLAGVMIRTPRDITDPAVDWQPGTMLDDGTNIGENYVFLSIGHGTDGQLSLEAKTTRNSDSQLELTPINTNTITLQIARVGDSVFSLYQLPGQEWVVHRRYTRADMPETIQVGLVSYTDWTKANDFDPFFHNSNVLQPGVADPTPMEAFNPDINAGFEYARFARPVVPAELASVDLVNAASDLQLLSFLGDVGVPDPGFDLPTIGDQSMSYLQDTLVIELPTAQPDGTPLTYSAMLLEERAFELDQEFQLEFAGDYHTDWGGQQEKWLQGDGGWYYVLPGGQLWQWQGDFAGSTLRETLSPRYYETPALLHDAQLVATADVVDGLLTVDPMEGFVGELELRLTVSDGTTSAVEDAMISVVNQAPALEVIPDQSIGHGQGPILVPVNATDADGDSVALSASVVQPLVYTLDQQLGLTTDGDYHENWGGQQEKWIQSAGGDWYFLLPDGEFREWAGTFEDSSLIATLDASVYAAPALLTDAEPLPVAVSMMGDTVVIDPSATYVGTFNVQVTADDGQALAMREFQVEVTNLAPVLDPIADQVLVVGGNPLLVPLNAADGDGDTLTYEVEVLQSPAYDLDQEYGFWSAGDYFTDWNGQQEKWIRDQDDAWYYFLPDGDLFRWEGSFETSTLIASLGVDYYNDPSLLTDPTAVALTAQIVGNSVSIQSEGDFSGTVQVRVTVSDGASSTSRTFGVQVTGGLDALWAEGDVLAGLWNLGDDE